MTTIVQKADLAAADFANDNTNSAGGISVKTSAGSAVGIAIAANNTLLAAPGGAARVGYARAGVGGQGRTEQDKLGEVVSAWDSIPAGTNIASVDCAPFIAIADADAVARGLTLVYTHGTYNMATNITTTAPTYFEDGAMLSVNTGVTVTLNGHVEASEYQIFSGAGTVVVGSNQHLQYPDWWGQPVSTVSSFPYKNAPQELLRGSEAEKFAITLAKAISFTDYPNFALNDRAKSAFASGSVKVSIVGDSITAGSDNWRSNTYVSMLKSKLKQTFPWINFTFVNYAIPGMTAATLVSDTYVGVTQGSYVLGTNFYFPVNNGGLNNNAAIATTTLALLNEDYWPTGSVIGKTWKQHIADSNPDMILYAFGMNDGTDINAFNTSYNAFQTYIQAQYPTNTPWFTLVSCFLPTKNPPAGQPHATWQVPAQSISDQVRYFAKRDNYGLIDANAVFDVLRDGTRHDYIPFTHEANWRYAQDTTKWTYGSGFDYYPAFGRAQGTGMAVRNIAARDIDFSATFTDIAFSGVYFVGRMSYRNQNLIPGGLTGYTVDTIIQSNTSIATIQVYYGATVIKTTTYDQGAVPVVGQTFAVKLRAYGDHLEVWFNNLLLLDFATVDSCYSGAVQVGVPNGAGAVSFLGLSYAETFAETPSHVDKLWIYGRPVYDATPTFQLYSDFEYNPDSIGGSVINHPSRWGHNTYYGFGIVRFVEELKQRVNSLSVNVSKRATSVYTTAAAPGTPELVATMPQVTVNLRTASTLLVRLDASYNESLGATYPQLGLFVDTTWAYSSYIPIPSSAVTMGQVSITFMVTLAAGPHTIAMGAARSAAPEVFTIGHAGTEYSMTVIDVTK